MATTNSSRTPRRDAARCARMKKLIASLLAFACWNVPVTAAETHPSTNTGSRLLRPLSMAEALDMALQQNSTIRKSAADLEATYGVVVQTRAIALPRMGITGGYTAVEESFIDRFQAPVSVGDTNINLGDAFEFANQGWSVNIRVTQSVYEGGRIGSALRSARLTREQALLQHQTVIANV